MAGVRVLQDRPTVREEARQGEQEAEGQELRCARHSVHCPAQPGPRPLLLIEQGHHPFGEDPQQEQVHAPGAEGRDRRGPVDQPVADLTRLHIQPQQASPVDEGDQEQQ